MPANTRARSETLQQAARALIEARGLDVTIASVPRPWAAEFAEAEGCTLETARRHLAKAARRMRSDASEDAERQWGGSREGAGRPRRTALAALGPHKDV
jgi:hypothetical protein